ncbi:MAG: LamG domain-containing protein [Candidatus Magasanikbacteria bacterium]
MKKRLLKILHIIVLSFFVFSTVGVQIAMANNNVGTMINMEEGDIQDSPFSDGGTIKALDFTSWDDIVNVGNDASLSITDKLSFVAWVECGNQSTRDHIASKYSAGQSAWLWRTYTQTGGARKLELLVIDNGTGGAGHTKLWYTTDDVLPVSGWAQVAFTFDGGVIKMYVNGIEITDFTKTSDDAITTIFDSTADLYIGNFTDTYSWVGDLTNVSIWDTAVLTQTDITNLYNSGNGLNPASISPTGGADLVSSWLWNTSLTQPYLIIHTYHKGFQNFQPMLIYSLF